jgi:isopenicillin-N epimerase
MQNSHQIGSAFWKDEFLLRPDIHFLNFGSFGACPRVIIDDYQQWQRMLESEPVQFIAFEGAKLLERSRKALATFVGCDADDLVYVTNPTYAVNIVAKSLKLQPNDEILTTNLEYGACDRTWEFYCDKAQAQYVRHPIALPIIDEETCIQDFLKGISPRTKLVFISHITSTTALRLPVEKLIPHLHVLGIPVFVDGAHAPGHIALDLKNLGADYYTGACHKWMMTAKGSSFLYVKPALQSGLEPLLVSWGYKSAQPSQSLFLDYHQMQGTRDFSAFLTIPKAIDYMQEHHWPLLSEECKKITFDFGRQLLNIVGSDALAPINTNFMGQMFSCPIEIHQMAAPANMGLQRMLYEKYHIEIPAMVHGSSTYLRFSTQVFTHPSDLQHLLSTVGQLVQQGIIKGA